MLGVFLSPQYATDRKVYLTYSEPGDGGSSLALARATLSIGEGRRESGRTGGAVAPDAEGHAAASSARRSRFRPTASYLFLTVGDRQRMTPAQDPDQALGKILRLTLDGKPAPGNPMAGKTGAPSVPLIDPPRDTELAKTAPVVSDLYVPRAEPGAGGNLDDRPSHAVRPRVRARRPAVGTRARPEGRRRAEPDRARQELRLAARVVRVPTTTACRSRARTRGPIWRSRSSTGRRSSRRAISRSTRARCSRSGRARR